LLLSTPPTEADFRGDVLRTPPAIADSIRGHCSELVIIVWEISKLGGGLKQAQHCNPQQEKKRPSTLSEKISDSQAPNFLVIFARQQFQRPRPKFLVRSGAPPWR
jgi:hypothetical protein